MIYIFIISVACLIGVESQVSLYRAVFEKLHQEPKLPDPVFRDNIEVRYIEQKLDHFNENENRTWWMRYMSNDYFFKEGGPIFIWVGGEWEITDVYLRGGHMYDMAKSLNGYMFYTEHRYYGRSQPFRTLATENLKYLSVRQALEDLKHFLISTKATIPGLQNAKVILLGGSYSGNMVTWFNRLYPDLVDGTWASSAPLRAKADFIEYKQIAGESIAKVGGQACYNRIKNAIASFEIDIENNNLDNIKKYLNLCSDFNPKNDKDVMILFASISDVFGAMVQIYNGPEIARACSEIMSASNDIEGVGNFVKNFLQPGSECIRVTHKDTVEMMQNTAIDGLTRQWYYQQCQEFGWFHNSGSKNQPFGSKFPLKYYIDFCGDFFGIDFDVEKVENNVAATNRLFGELNPQVKNIFYTQGGLDPWHTMGISCNGECGTVLPLYTHAKDFESVSSNDTQDMVELKRTVFELVKRWTNLN